MPLKKRIPKDFYKLFRTRNMDAYMMFLTAVYDESNAVYTASGLTIEEGQSIIGETISGMQIEWMEDVEETQSPAGNAVFETAGTPSAILNTLIGWGWMRSDYDERLNTYILSFPEYSQLYVELFKKLQSEDDSRERESILSVYSALYTYQSDQEKNNEILKSALHTSKNLELLLSSMQNGMRTYFDKLSRSKNFIEIQQVLVNEINNSDSEKYAILTTTDSFYRYKESVKELISQILNENDRQKTELRNAMNQCEKNTAAYLRAQKAVTYNEEADELVYKIEREFDLIERKYNKLVEQKAIFAKRALARIQYIFQEGSAKEDSVLRLIQMIDRSSDPDAILDGVRAKIGLTAPFKMFDDNSMYRRRDSSENRFEPLAIEREEETDNTAITDFVPKPLYTKKQLKAFCDKNVRDGVFQTTDDTVQSVADLEKMIFLWQDIVGKQDGQDYVKLGEELHSENGFAFTELSIDLKNGGLDD
ncbi:MAG: hypothetical protein K2K74_07355 [Lachnospiraceae bacterium]|nr:hypothetical protein [Lachnospiraceae bacterium]